MSYIIAVDFDGTLCKNKYPEIGKPNRQMIKYLKKRQQDGVKLILWTCREDEFLDNAICWSRNQGLIFDAVNENLPEIIAEFGRDTRKIFANEYIDDRNNIEQSKPFHTTYNENSMLSWAENEVQIACKCERGNKPEDEWDYGCACYESALKAYKAMAEDGHSGFSWNITRQILDRLTKGIPLTPIEDTDDVWDDVSRFCGGDGSYTIYQCKRMHSLFKNVYNDGRVEYKDNDRFCCYNKTEYGDSYHLGLVDRIMYEKFPITMPYYPGNTIKVICEDYLTDYKNGDFDTVGILYAIKPDGERIEISRFFKKDHNDFKEISVKEYHDRIVMHMARENKEVQSNDTNEM